MVTFHLQLLQHMGYIPRAVQHIFEPILYPTGASLVAQMVKNLPAVWETPRFDPWVRKIPWRRAWQPTPVFLPGESLDRGAWWAAVKGVAKSQTQLKRLSMHTRGWDTALVASFLPQMQSLICKTKPWLSRLFFPGPSTGTLSSFYTSCPPTQQNARETATMVLILFIFQRELFGLLILSVFQRGLFGLSQFD